MFENNYLYSLDEPLATQPTRSVTTKPPEIQAEYQPLPPMIHPPRADGENRLGMTSAISASEISPETAIAVSSMIGQAPMPMTPSMPPLFSPGDFTRPMPLPENLCCGHPMFSPGFLMQQLSKTIRLEMQVGSSLVERTGRLLAVGANYILLQHESSQIMCETSMIRFITVMD